MNKNLLLLLFPLATMFKSSNVFAADPSQSKYDAAMATITNGIYYLVTDVNGTKYYVTTEGELTGEKENGGLFTIYKASGGDLYDVGILIEPDTGSHFSNTTLINNKANLHPGSFCLNSTYNRDNWERQVFFQNSDGKFAIRTSNTAFGTSGWADAGRVFWTYEVNEANIPTPCYSYDPAYVWTLEPSINDGIIMINGINYIIYNDRMAAEVTFLPNNEKYSGNVFIPSSINYNGNTYTITRIGNSAFRDCTDLISVTIPDGITSIGGSAFYNCISMEKVIVSDLAAWCEISFAGYDSNPLSKAQHLYSNEFTEIINLVIPDGVTNIGSYSFRYCTGLTSAIIPNTVTSIGDYAFDGCSGLTSITIPNSVTSIGYGSLWGCSGLTSIPIPNSVTDIGGKAFERCSGLTSITIPESVTSIGECAFRYCSGLQKVIVPNLAAWCGISFGDNYTANPLTNAHHLFIDESTEITNLVIPDGVTFIGNSAFRECPDLTSVTFPNSITSIGECVFDRCTGLTTVTIPNSITNIGYAALWGCTGLTSITIGSGVTNIDEIAFEGCKNLSDFYCYAKEVPETNIEAFKGSPIASATLHVLEGSWDAYSTTEPWSGFGKIVTIDNSSNIIFADANVKAICIENWDINGNGELSEAEAAAVTSLGNVFQGNTSIKSFDELQYFTGLASIDEKAFYGCTRLTSVTIPRSVTIIGSYSFLNCNGLKSVTISESVTTIGVYAFYQCTSLTSITIPNSVSSICEFAFRGCSGLTSITIPNNVTIISNGAFEDCTGLTSAIIPHSVTSISWCAFSGCSSLTSIGIPNSVTAIGGAAFYDCSGLTFITIPGSVTTIGGAAFYGCNKLKFVKVENPEPYEIEANTFTNCSNAVLQVPTGSKASYQAVDNWKEFRKIVENITDIKAGDVNVDEDVNVVDVVDIARFVVGSPSESFFEFLADINTDGTVNLGDAVTLVNDIAGDQNFVKAWVAPSNLATNDAINLTGSDGCLSLNLENEHSYTAFQFDLYVPDDTEVSQMLLNAERKQGHQLLYNKVENGHYRVAALSTSNRTFDGDNGELLSIALNEIFGEEVSVRNIHFFDTIGNDYLFEDVYGSSPTSIHQIDNGQWTIDNSVYDLQGRKREKLQRGVNIVNGKKILF